VQNYVDKFKRTVALVKEGYDINRISFLLRISTSLVEQYVNLYHGLDFAAHREEELNGFLKKRLTSNNQEASS
jgi:predicted transcriptional regulator